MTDYTIIILEGDNLLKQIRERIGYTQVELAKKSGVNIRQIQRYEAQESDIRNMTLRNAVAIADTLGVNVEDLIKK